MFLSILALSLCFGIIFCNTLVLQAGHLAGSQCFFLTNLTHIRFGFTENNLGRGRRSSSWVACGCVCTCRLLEMGADLVVMGAHLVGSTKLVLPPGVKGTTLVVVR